MIDMKKADASAFTALVSELAEKNYAEVEFSVTRADLVEGAEKFFEYLSATPLEERLAFHLNDRPGGRQGVGYMRKVGAEDEVGRTDLKEYFHYHPKLLTIFAGNPVLERAETKAFLSVADRIYQEALLRSKELYRVMSVEFPDLYSQFIKEGEEHIEYSALRFLKYEAAGKGKFLARAHYDRGATTLAIAESAPGLRIGKNNETLKEVVHKDNVALFMPAFQLPAITDMRFRPAWHDVVQSSEDVYRDNAARWAIVFFADTADVPVPTKEESHTPLV